MKTSFLILILSFTIFTTNAQESANSSGGDATGIGGNVAYSVGQIEYTSNSGGNGTIDQGVQHAYEIFTVSIKETELYICIVAFPNPLAENLTLQISDYTMEKFSYQLFDIQGKQLGNGQITAQQTQIKMNNLPNGAYYVNIINQENKTVQSFEIIKN